MRVASLFLTVALLAVSAGAAEVRFVAPLDGSQSFGLMLIEIATDVATVDRVEFQVDGMLAGVARRAPYRIAFDFGTSLDSRTITATVWSDGYKKKDVASVTTAAMTANETLNVDLVEVPLRVKSSRTLKAS
ncbi:MAG TPA: Ig-like domain-containing protein, partial [Thermoanaerobaculia bacterium]